MDEYGVFKGIPQLHPFQLGLVSDLQRATDLMARMNARIPGNYFVRHMVTREVVATLHCAAEDEIPGSKAAIGEAPSALPRSYDQAIGKSAA